MLLSLLKLAVFSLSASISSTCAFKLGKSGVTSKLDVSMCDAPFKSAFIA